MMMSNRVMRQDRSCGLRHVKGSAGKSAPRVERREECSGVFLSIEEKSVLPFLSFLFTSLHSHPSYIPSYSFRSLTFPFLLAHSPRSLSFRALDTFRANRWKK